MRDALEYHDATKHDFHRFARSRGSLDWANQPNPFRQYPGAPRHDLSRVPAAGDVPYDCLFDGTAARQPLTDITIADFLRCAMGLSAWKRYQSTRWALRVNPSSGNLHPTEAYLVRDGRVLHYAPGAHAIEERCTFSRSSALLPPDSCLVALTSIAWREAWKYGERAFRYCQHDIGHALGALRFSAARLGWHLRVLTAMPDATVAALLGLDRDDDYPEQAERETAECLLLLDTAGVHGAWGEPADFEPLAEAARAGEWHGRANRLSPARVEWEVIDQVAAITRSPASAPGASAGSPLSPWSEIGNPNRAQGRGNSHASLPARAVILQRRSAVAFDGTSTLPGARLLTMLARLLPGAPPWDVLPSAPEVHLAIFVHRVEGLVPGVYLFLRDAAAEAGLRAALRPEFLWEPIHPEAFAGTGGGLFLLLPTDVTWPATRLSCDQDIAGEGFFSLGMIAKLGPDLVSHPWLYRRRFWEAGLIGQVLYLEAEAAGARSTGIGCFYDDPVHELLGLTHSARTGLWQSLYHFSMGVPVEDPRLSTERGYPWE